MKIALYGTYLPEIGGISIHNSRLAALLHSEGMLECVYSTCKLKGLQSDSFPVKDVSFSKLRYGFFISLYGIIKYFFKDNSTIIHFHGNPVWHSTSIFMLSTVLKKKMVITLHDQMMLENIGKYPFLFQFFFKKLLLDKMIRWIVVNPKIKEQLQFFEIKCDKIYVIPAYLPVFSIPDKKDGEIVKFVVNKERIITIYAHSTALFNGKDLYGIDLAIRAIKEVKLQFPNIGLIVCIPGDAAVLQMEYYKKIINELNVEENILMNLKPLNNTIGLLQISDVLLRPTLTDGDSIMVREALSVGTFVVASDVVERPAGVVLFESENLDNMVSKLIEVLRRKKGKGVASSPLSDNNYSLIKEVYKTF